MKRKVGFLVVMLTVWVVNAHAQKAFEYLTESLANVLAVSTIIQLADYEYNGDNALWGTYLEKGKSISLNSQYDKGIEYLMFAAADDLEGIDVDLKVYQGQGTNGTVITKDTALDAAPLVRFTPSSSGWYCFELINSGEKPAFVSMVILKAKKNANFSLDTLTEALANTLELSKQIAALLPSNSEIPANKWTLFGGNIKQGSSVGYYNTELSRGAYVLVGAGENSVNNCDVEVIEQYSTGNSDGKKISQNTDSRYPFDFAVFQADSSKRHYLKVINQSSKNTTSFMFGFLILAK